MQAIWAICRRDWRAAFGSPLMWLVLAAWLALVDLVFYFSVASVAGHATPASEPLFVSTLAWGVFILALLAPALTMNSFATERTQGTMQLLLTVPITELQLVLGKFLAALGMLLALVVATLVQPVVLSVISYVPWPQLACGYLGLVLTCMLYAGLGVWVSLVVDSAVSAYVLTFAGIALLFLIGYAAHAVPLPGVGEAIGLGDRSGEFFAGDLRLGSVLYFLGGATVFLVLAHSALQARRIDG